MEEYTQSRIQGMTEHELVRALCRGQITQDRVRAVLGSNPRADSIISEYELYRARNEDPDLYWDGIIDSLRRQIEVAEENKINRVLPTIPYGF